MPGCNRYLWLSRPLLPGMAAYNGRDDFQARPADDMARGAANNSLRLAFKNHVGTHFDFPRHFFADGKSVDDYAAADFIFSRPALVDIPLEQGRYINDEDLKAARPPEGADLLLIRTGYGAFYGQDKYWNDNPGLDSTAAAWLKRHHPSIRCLGMDFLSVNAHRNKEPGRAGHRAFLSPPEILLIEDMDLSPLNGAGPGLSSVVAAPLRIGRADGAPCTVIGQVDFS